MSILEELYNGNINPSEKYIKNGSAYQKLNKQLTEQIYELMTLLNNEEKLLFEKIGDNISALNYISEKERFIEGFRIGVHMMWEIIHFKSANFI